jgi:hypothetical protein
MELDMQIDMYGCPSTGTTKGMKLITCTSHLKQVALDPHALR